MFAGRVALITGAFGCIGKAISQVLACNNIRGMTLIDTKIDNEFVCDMLKEYKECELNCIKCDVTNCRDLNNAFQETCCRFGQLDIVINNAGVFDEINPDRQLYINLNSVMISTVLAHEKYLPKFKCNEDGIILNVSSIFGLMPMEFAPYHSISKQGVVSIGRTLGSDHNYRRTCVRIITLCPGFTQTPILSQTSSIPKHYEPICMDFDCTYKQSPCHLASETAKIIATAETGSVWVVERDRPATEIELNPIAKNYRFNL